MTIKEVKDYYKDRENHPCPLTEKLVKAGYQQKDGGYIARGQKEGVLVDYTKNSPSQYWHLMTYCDSKKDDDLFTKSVVCGELIFWMAEVSDNINKDLLIWLVDQIINDSVRMDGNRPVYDRKKWNAEIQRICFECIRQCCFDRSTIPHEVIEKSISMNINPDNLLFYKEHPQYGLLYKTKKYGLITGRPWYIAFKNGEARWLTCRDDRNIISF